MDRIRCKWCTEQNPPDRTDCVKCGAPLDVQDRIKDPEPKPVALPTSVWSPASVQLPTPSSRARGWATAIVVAVVLVLVVVGFVLDRGHSGNSTSGSSTTPLGSSTTPQPPPNLLTLGWLSGLLAQIQTKFGDTMGY